jgi:hypothetical protein
MRTTEEKKPVDGHRPEAQHVSGRERDQADGLHPWRNAIAPIKAAAVEPRNDPMHMVDWM